MTITVAERLRIDIRNAYEVHDREALERALKRIPEFGEDPFQMGGAITKMLATEASGVAVVVEGLSIAPPMIQGSWPCAVCGVPFKDHGSAPTCASHDWRYDE